MTVLSWQIDDRINRVWVIVCLVLAVIGLLPMLWDQMTTALLLWIGLLLIQAWFYATMRKVTATVDGTGITKKLGHETWTAPWPEITRARLRLIYGSTQLILVTKHAVGDWGFSNKLFGFGRVPREGQAVQVDPLRLPDLERALAQRGITLER